MSKPSPLATLVLVVGLSWLWSDLAAAEAEIYRWTDEGGRLSFTDRPSAVPAQARATLTRLASRATDPVQRIESRATRLALQRTSSGHGVEVPFRRDGGLMRVDVRLNQQLVAPFYIDTAASGVSIPTSVARALGLEREAQKETTTAITAGGRTELGVIELESVELGGARLERVAGTVNPQLDIGLLGSSFLNQFNYFVDSKGGVILFESLPATERPGDAAEEATPPSSTRPR